MALRQGQEDPFARRPEEQDALDPGVAQEAEVRNERIVVELAPPSRSGVRAAAIVLAITAMLVPATARASDLLDVNAGHVTLEVHGATCARHVHGGRRERHVLAWGAINAGRPLGAAPAGALRARLLGRAEARAPGDVEDASPTSARPYDGPPLAYLVTACTAPDGSYWALQSWQRNLPHRGVAPWTAAQRAWELRLSHWNGALAHVELYTDWAFGERARHLRPPDLRRRSGVRLPLDLGRRADRLLRPQPLHRHLRLGLRPRVEARDVDRLPQADRRVLLLVLADARQLAAGQPGETGGERHRYRISVVGPGVTPDVVAETPDPGPFDAKQERRRDALFTQVIAGDRFCSTQH